MRILVDLVALLALLALVAGAALHHRAGDRQRAEVQSVRSAVGRLEQTLRIKAATGEVEVNGRGWPVDINPDWFGDDPPRNSLLSSGRPWLEIASSEPASLTNPAVRIAYDRSVAAFWYNPANGAIRARIPATVSDQRAVELYNRINGVALRSIFQGVGETGDSQQHPADPAPEGR